MESAGIPSLLERAGIDGVPLGHAVLNPGGGPRRVMVRPEHAEAAQRLLAGTVATADPDGWPEGNGPAEQEATGWKPRDYGVIGAYARIWAVGLGVFAVVFGLFALSRLA